MTLYTYTGTLTDIGLGVLAGSSPLMRVRPEREAFGPDGLVSAKPRPVTVSASTGGFSMSLIPSGELSPSMGGQAGVDYIISVGLFDETIDGGSVHVTDVWRFTAVAGGGNVGQMAGGSVLAVWVGPPWPSAPLPKGLYIDKAAPNPWGVVS